MTRAEMRAAVRAEGLSQSMANICAQAWGTWCETGRTSDQLEDTGAVEAFLAERGYRPARRNTIRSALRRVALLMGVEPTPLRLTRHVAPEPAAAPPAAAVDLAPIDARLDRIERTLAALAVRDDAPCSAPAQPEPATDSLYRHQLRVIVDTLGEDASEHALNLGRAAIRRRIEGGVSPGGGAGRGGEGDVVDRLYVLCRFVLLGLDDDAVADFEHLLRRARRSALDSAAWSEG